MNLNFFLKIHSNEAAAMKSPYCEPRHLHIHHHELNKWEKLIDHP
jgi:hypothetical protein